MELARVLRTGILAGAAAGLIMGLLFLALQEPLIDRAICYEQEQPPDCMPEEGEVLRVHQKIVLVAASPLFGLALGAFFALVYASFHPYLPGKTSRQKSMLLALLAFLVFPLLPALRLPPFPPGVENTMPTDLRDLWYALIMLGGVGGMGLALVVNRLLVRRDASPRGRLGAGIVSVAVMLAVAAIPILLFPGSEFTGNVLLEEPSLLPRYQAISVGSIGAFWLSLGFLFSSLWTRAELAGVREGQPEVT
jgi:predicted cobalt transporter CbtA